MRDEKFVVSLAISSELWDDPYLDVEGESKRRLLAEMEAMVPDGYADSGTITVWMDERDFGLVHMRYEVVLEDVA